MDLVIRVNNANDTKQIMNLINYKYITSQFFSDLISD